MTFKFKKYKFQRILHGERGPKTSTPFIYGCFPNVYMYVKSISGPMVLNNRLEETMGLVCSQFIPAVYLVLEYLHCILGEGQITHATTATHLQAFRVISMSNNGIPLYDSACTFQDTCSSAWAVCKPFESVSIFLFLLQYSNFKGRVQTKKIGKMWSFTPTMFGIKTIIFLFLCTLS